MTYQRSAVLARPERREHSAGAIVRPAPGRRDDARLPPVGGGQLAVVGPVLLRWQREQGNRYVQRAVAAIRQTRLEAAVVQGKPALGPSSDRYERVAEHTAQQVAGGRPVPGIERVFGSAAGVTDVDPGVQREIGQARGGGKSLPDGIRRSMEQAYGADFSAVRTHSDARADQLTRSLDALALTAGRDIFFRRGAYAPATGAWQRLLAHELTHVVQQGGGPPPGRPEPGQGTTGRIQRYLFHGLGRPYQSRKAFEQDLGPHAYSGRSRVQRALQEYEDRVSRGRDKTPITERQDLTPGGARRDQDLLIDLLTAIDRALLDHGKVRSAGQELALHRLRSQTQHELSVVGAVVGKPPASLEDAPTAAESQHGGTDPNYLASWLRRQPIFRKWAWLGASQCAPAAREIFDYLSQNDAPTGQIAVKVRAIVAYPPLGLENLSMANHFVTVVHLQGGTMVVDPTMSQFLGCRKPMVADEDSWKALLAGSLVDFDQQYRAPSRMRYQDFDSFNEAVNYSRERNREFRAAHKPAKQ